MSPVRRAVTGLVRLTGTGLIFFGVMLGGLAAARVYLNKEKLPVGDVLGAVAMGIVGLVMLLKSSALAAKLAEWFDE